MNDPHMHERGMLERIDHPELGEIVVPTTPLPLHGTDKVAAGPSPTIGQHNAEVYRGWLGLSASETAGTEGQWRPLDLPRQVFSRRDPVNQYLCTRCAKWRRHSVGYGHNDVFAADLAKRFALVSVLDRFTLLVTVSLPRCPYSRHERRRALFRPVFGTGWQLRR